MTKRLLLCDDEVHILRAAEFKLKKAGYDVRTASDGQEAFEVINADCPDLVVTDYQMPRCDGLQLIARLRDQESTAQLPIVLLTAKGLELEREELISRFHLAGIFSKPFSPRELLARVEEMIGEPGARDQGLGASEGVRMCDV